MAIQITSRTRFFLSISRVTLFLLTFALAAAGLATEHQPTNEKTKHENCGSEDGVSRPVHALLGGLEGLLNSKPMLLQILQGIRPVVFIYDHLAIFMTD